MNPTPSEEPKSDVGSILRQKRMQKGASLETVHQQTRIPKKLLEALEANKIDAFPAPIYLRGFLKGYCDYLETDFEPLFKQLVPAAHGAEPAPPEDKPSRAPAPAAPAAKKSRHDQEASAPMMLPLNEATLIPFILVVAIVAAAAVMWLFRDTGSKEAALHPMPLPAEINPVNPPNEPTLRLVALKDTWVKLKVDGKLEFEGRFPSGAGKDWKAKRDFSLRTSNPADLQILLEGKETPLSRFPLDPDGFRTIAR